MMETHPEDMVLSAPVSLVRDQAFPPGPAGQAADPSSGTALACRVLTRSHLTLKSSAFDCTKLCSRCLMRLCVPIAKAVGHENTQSFAAA